MKTRRHAGGFVRVTTVGILVLSTLTGAASGTTLGDWNTATNVDTGTANWHHNMAVDLPNNMVHVVYVKSGTVYHRAVARPSGTLGTPVAIAANADTPSIGVDSAGGLHVAFCDVSGSTNLSYTYSANGGATWSTPLVLDSAPNQGYGTAMAVDAANRIHIVYRGTNGMRTDTPTLPYYELWYVRFGSNATQVSTLTPGNWDAAQCIPCSDGRKIRDTSVFAGMMFYDIDCSSTKVWIQRYNGGLDTDMYNYYYERALGAAAGSSFTEHGRYTLWIGQEAIGPSNDFWRVHNSRNTSPRGCRTNHCTNNWVSYDTQDVETNDLSFSYLARYADIIVDSSRMVHLAYRHDVNTCLRYAYSVGDGVWTNETIPNSSGYHNADVRMTLDPDITANARGEIYILGANGGTLRLFSRGAQILPVRNGTVIYIR